LSGIQRKRSLVSGRSSAGPGPLPGPSAGSGTAGPLFAALYGSTDGPLAGNAREADEYALFYQRSLAMGWLDDRSAGGDELEVGHRAAGLWAMNDAGTKPPNGADNPRLVAWYQVEASEVADDRPLPIRPFLACAHEVTLRCRPYDLSAVQVLAPMRGINALRRPTYAALPTLLASAWFDDRTYGSEVLVNVELNSGTNPAVAESSVWLAAQLNSLNHKVFSMLSQGPQTSLPYVPLADSAWNGPTERGLIIRGSLAEWSCDCIGWLVEILCDLLGQKGLRSPLLITVSLSPTTPAQE
jgi:hypothetical protein